MFTFFRVARQALRPDDVVFELLDSVRELCSL
jgi:hypothetical protein